VVTTVSHRRVSKKTEKKEKIVWFLSLQECLRQIKRTGNGPGRVSHDSVAREKSLFNNLSGVRSSPAEKSRANLFLRRKPEDDDRGGRNECSLKRKKQTCDLVG